VDCESSTNPQNRFSVVRLRLGRRKGRGGRPFPERVGHFSANRQSSKSLILASREEESRKHRKSKQKGTEAFGSDPDRSRILTLVFEGGERGDSFSSRGISPGHRMGTDEARLEAGRRFSSCSSGGEKKGEKEKERSSSCRRAERHLCWMNRAAISFHP